MDFRVFVVGMAVLCTSVSSAALTLGRVRGAAILGQPLDISIQVQLDADEAASSLCVEADVFHADTRQDSGRVRVSVEAAQQAQAANVRIYSSGQVDEPMVTVYLKAGCNQKSTRKYVLLADYATEASLPATPLVLSPALMAPAGGAGAATTAAPAQAAPVNEALPAARPGSAATGSSGSAPAPVAAVANRRQAEPPAPRKIVRAKAPAAAPVAKAEVTVEKNTTPPKAARGAGQSRLKLDPLVMLAERVASLETTTATPPPEVIKDAQRLQSLEGDVKALLALAAKNEAALLEMRLRLQKAEADRLPAEWVYALAAVVIAGMGLLAFVLSRRRPVTQGPTGDGWWSGSKVAPLAPSAPQVATPVSIPADLASDDGSGQPADREYERPAVTPLQRPHQVSTTRVILDDDPASEMDVSLVEMSPSNFDNLMQSSESHSALRKGPLPKQPDAPRSNLKPEGERRSINSEALFDIRQRAEFFVSLGQTDQAVRILENRINDDGEGSPLLYLDLLQIFHSLGLKTDFRQFREDFNLLFNGRVPEFDSFLDEGRGIEGYPHVLAHIIALWGTPKVLMVIESSIFRDPWDDKSPPFELAAFRDLLLLHAIAQTAPQSPALKSRPLEKGASPSSDADATLATNGNSGDRAMPLPVDLNLSMPGPLDLDLDAHHNESTQPAGQSGGAHQDFPVLITDEGSGSQKAKAPDAGNLLDFSLPDAPLGPVSKSKH